MDPRGSRAASDSVFQSDVPTGACTIHTADSVVRVCNDSHILGSNGNPTGLYHLAGEYCPEDSIITMCLPDYDRKQIGTATANDNMYRKSVVEAHGSCEVHTSSTVVPDPAPADPEDPDEPAPDPSGSSTDPAAPSEPGGNTGGQTQPTTPEPPPSQDIG